jgi:cystathionine beta-lyase/cystathionine gamma-synthase
MGLMRELAESQSAAMAAVERRLRLLETRVEAIAEAVDVLARGLEGSPTAEPVNHPASEAGRRAHELLLLAKPDRNDG